MGTEIIPKFPGQTSAGTDGSQKDFLSEKSRKLFSKLVLDMHFAQSLHGLLRI